MRLIKFRGHALYDSCGQSVDKIVYGDFVQEYDKVDIADWDDGDIYEVTPESVAQLIGIDANGREVYEGDTVIRIAPSPDWKDGDFNPEKTYPMAAAFDDYAAIRDEAIILVVKDNGRTDKDTGGRTA